MIEHEIRHLLAAPAAGTGAPSLATLEDTLTSGYAHALALDAERLRLQRAFDEAALRLASRSEEATSGEVRRLARRLQRTESELIGLRYLLESLHARTSAARAA